MSALTVDRDRLEAALVLVAGFAASAANGVPRVACVTLEGGGGQLRLSATDLDAWLTHVVPAEGEFAAAVQAEALLNAVKRAPRGAQVAFERKDDRVVVLAGRFRVTLPEWPIDDLAPAQAVDGEPMSLEVPTLRRALEDVRAACSRDDARPWLGGVHLKNGSAVAMDTFRAHSTHLAGADGGIILPRMLVNRLLTVLPETGSVEVRTSKGRVAVGGTGFTLTGNLVDGQFPDHSGQFPDEMPIALRAQADHLLWAFDILSIVADGRERAVTLELSADGCRAMARTVNPSPAAGEIELDADYQGPPVTITFAFLLVRDALARFGQHQVEWRMSAWNKITNIVSDAAPGLEVAVMPCLPGADERPLLAA